jgi:hypothetical protein
MCLQNSSSDTSVVVEDADRSNSGGGVDDKNVSVTIDVDGETERRTSTDTPTIVAGRKSIVVMKLEEQYIRNQIDDEVEEMRAEEHAKLEVERLEKERALNEVAELKRQLARSKAM